MTESEIRKLLERQRTFLTILFLKGQKISTLPIERVEISLSYFSDFIIALIHYKS